MFRLTNAGADAAGMSGPQRGAAPVLSGPCAPIPDVPALVRPDGLVIQAFQLKYRVMPARSLALGLLLLLCVTPIGWAAEPAGATIVLQLPASMSPDQVKGLIADLAAKGAEPAVTSVDPPSADPPPLMTGMKLTVRIWEETKKAMRAVPALRQVPQVWVRHVEAEGGTRDDALRFWAIAAVVPSKENSPRSPRSSALLR